MRDEMWPRVPAAEDAGAMIVIFEPYGRLCNRLFLSAYGMALARASNQRLFNLSLGDYRYHFPAMRPPRGLPIWRFHLYMRALIVGLKRFPPARRWFVRVGWKDARAFSPDNPQFVAEIKKRFLTIIEGWADPSQMRFSPDTSEAIRTTFVPDAAVTEIAHATVSRAREGADVLIGVHIRQKDYRTYLQGFFYYQPEHYRRILEKMTAMFPGRRVAFLICSDEEQKAESFAPFQVTLGPGTVLEDLYSLAGCDYLIGPPSTFSLWAAFYAGKPLYHMIEPQPPADLSSFVIPDGHFECIDLKLFDPEAQRSRAQRFPHFRPPQGG
jgi:hypothetical protein